MLKAIEDQTASFDWKGMQLAVAAKLELGEAAAQEPLPMVTLHGLLSALPVIQFFPEEHILQISTGLEVCAVVTWAHTLLGLNVLVRDKQFLREVRFGSASVESLIVVMERAPGLSLFLPQSDKTAGSVTLLSSSSNEPIFSLKAEEELDIVAGTFTHTARGYAKKIIEREIPQKAPGRDRVVEELSHVATAYALCISRKLYTDPPFLDDFRPDVSHILASLPALLTPIRFVGCLF